MRLFSSIISLISIFVVTESFAQQAALFSVEENLHFQRRNRHIRHLYYYDSQGVLLKTESYIDTHTTPTWWESYSYDSHSNRVEKLSYDGGVDVPHVGVEYEIYYR